MPTFSMMCGFKVCFLIHGKRALAQINYRLKRSHSFKGTLWGLTICQRYGYMVIPSWGSLYPLSEHVDIFPVRLVPTFHWVFSVYLILAIYLHSRLYPCGRNKRQGLDPFIFSIKDSLHIPHKWHGTFYYSDTTVYIMTIPSSPLEMWYGVKVILKFD